MIKHVWFDTSGTLYFETPEIIAFADSHRYEAYSRLIKEPDIHKVKEIYDAMYEKYGSNSSVFHAIGMPRDYWQKEFEAMDINQLLKPNEEITATLNALKSMLPISILTNLRINKLKDMLAHLQIPENYFTHFITAEDVRKAKPDLEGFRKMIDMSGAPPSEILYVGDKVNKDIKPAKELGVKTCLVWSRSPEADNSIMHFKELLNVLASSIAQ